MANHTDFGEWRVTHNDFRIYHALQPCTLEVADYADAEKLVNTVSAISAKDWATSKTVDEHLHALDFAVDLMHRHHEKGSADEPDAGNLKNPLKPD